MAELANFPMISQRDGDVNASLDCVPASIAACMQWLTGQHYTASEIKDAVYGTGYTGGTAASAYVDYCAARGVILSPVNGDGIALVAALHNALAEQHPALITEPDPYASGWTHVCAAYQDDASSITVMDPWIDQPVTKSDAAWAAQLQFNQIWTLEKAMLTIHEATQFFTDLGNNVWKCANGNHLGHGMLGYYCRTGPAPLFGLTLLGLPLTEEIAVAGQKGVVLQVFERGVLTYDPAHVLDHPPGAGDVYTTRLDSGPALAQLSRFLPAPTPQPAPGNNTIISELQALRTTIETGLARVLADLGKS
jgi:hypothetical protein